MYIRCISYWPNVVYHDEINHKHYTYRYSYRVKYKYRWTLSFRYERFINFFYFGSSTRGERHNSYNANYPNPRRILFKISVGRDLQNSNGKELNSQLTLFQNPQTLRTICSGDDVIHIRATFPVWGFITTMVIGISLAYECKTLPNDYAPEFLTRIVQSPNKLNDKI